MNEIVTEYYSAKNAADDVKNARDLDGDYKKQETFAVLATIESLALQGINNKSFEGLEDIVVSRLINLGFKCVRYPGSLRDSAYHDISW